MKLSNIILAFILAIILFYAFFTGMQKSEQVECYKWQKWAETQKDFYLLEWQDEQCKAHGIIIDTKIIRN